MFVGCVVYLLVIMKHNPLTKGFTLIELIIVIALIAFLATTVILVVNPARIFQEARDARRIADLSQMNQAVLLTMSSSVPSLGSCAGSTAPRCYQNVGASNCVARYVATTPAMTANTIASQSVAGSGWVPINLTLATLGAPLTAWPIDQRNNGTYFYSYMCDTAGHWEFTANMESTRYSTGTDDAEGKDGGNQDTLFEIGTNVGL